MAAAHLHLLVNHVPILGTLFALVLGVYGAARRQPDVGLAPSAAVLVGAALVFGPMARAGTLGGQIRHPEIRDGTTEVRGPDAAPYEADSYEVDPYEEDDE